MSKPLSKKTQFLQRCRDMDLKTARQAQSVLSEELGLTRGTCMVYYSDYLKETGRGVKRPRKVKEGTSE